MISYAPFGDDEVKVLPQVPTRHNNKKTSSKKLRRSLDDFLGDDNTECNYLVMFFVLGVCVLAITDSLK